jgi:hypothetical protein
MKVIGLTQDQMEKLDDLRFYSMPVLCPAWLAENMSNLMVESGPKWMSNHRRLRYTERRARAATAFSDILSGDNEAIVVEALRIEKPIAREVRFERPWWDLPDTWQEQESFERSLQGYPGSSWLCDLVTTIFSLAVFGLVLCGVLFIIALVL